MVGHEARVDLLRGPGGMEAAAASARVARIQDEPSSSQRERACNRVRKIKTKHVKPPA
jgi:hypothetical protein